MNQLSIIEEQKETIKKFERKQKEKYRILKKKYEIILKNTETSSSSKIEEDSDPQKKQFCCPPIKLSCMKASNSKQT